MSPSSTPDGRPRAGHAQAEAAAATPDTGTFTAAAGTTLYLGNMVLAPSSVVSSDGFVSVTGCTEAGSYRAAGGTYAQSSSFTGPVLDVGSSLEVYGLVSFAPAVGGPVPLTIGTLTIELQFHLVGHRQLRGQRDADVGLRRRSSASPGAWTPTAGWL